MASEIQTINDEKLYDKIFNNYFENNNVQIKMSNGTITVYFLGYNDNQAAFRINGVKNLPKVCTLVTKKNDQLVYATLLFIDKQEDNLFVFKPVKFQIISTTKREDRKSLDSEKGGKKLIYMINIVTDFFIDYDLHVERKRLDKFRDKIIEDMDKSYEFIKLYFSSDGNLDTRMKYFKTNKKPLYIQDIKAEEVSSNKDEFFNYINNIYSTDYYIKNHEFISEIAVPLLYQMKMPYGYLQVNSKRKLLESDFKSLKGFTIKIDQALGKYNIIKPSDEKFIIINISKKGFAIAIRERKHLRSFKINSAVNLDILLPDNKKASIHAIVRHITQQENKIIIIGFEIIDIDSIGEVNYDEFIDTLNV